MGVTMDRYEVQTPSQLHGTIDTHKGLIVQADWNIVKKGWDAHVLGEAPHKFKDPVEAVKTLRVLLDHIC